MIITPDTSQGTADHADDLARVVRLRQTYLRMVPDLQVVPDIPTPVVRTASIMFTDIRGFSRLTERFAVSYTHLTLPTIYSV